MLLCLSIGGALAVLMLLAVLRWIQRRIYYATAPPEEPSAARAQRFTAGSDGARTEDRGPP
jgi:hypothetical protein